MTWLERLLGLDLISSQKVAQWEEEEKT